MSEIRFHSGDPRRPTRSAEIDERTGMAIAVLLVVAGGIVLVGLAGAPDLLFTLVRSVDRLSVRETAQRGAEAYASVRRRSLKVAERLAADELFLARVATLAAFPLPEEFPADPPAAELPPTTDPDAEVAILARRVREFETLRRRLAAATKVPQEPDPARIPSRSPAEPTSSVPIAVFGPRISPLTHHPEFYAGLGLAVPAGALVIAPAAGSVVFAGTLPPRAGADWRKLGTLLVLAHGPNMRTIYAHLSKILVRPRQRLARGDAIARVGQTGWATGPQLHYEVRRLVNGKFLPVDPRLYILDVDWISAAELRKRPAAPPDLDLPTPLK